MNAKCRLLSNPKKQPALFTPHGNNAKINALYIFRKT
jgi:hypothetical protein